VKYPTERLDFVFAAELEDEPAPDADDDVVLLEPHAATESATAAPVRTARMRRLLLRTRRFT
jgi:hypothetical protein